MEVLRLTSDNATFYRYGEETSTTQIGNIYDSASQTYKPAVVRYTFTTPETEIKSVSLSLKNWGIQYGSLVDCRFYIGTDPTSHINAGETYDYTGDLVKQTGALFTADAEIFLQPNSTYYLWVFPLENDTYSVLTWNEAVLELTVNFIGTVTGSILSQIGYNGGWDSEYKTNSSEYAGYYDTPYVCIMKLDIPSLSGVINKLQLELKYSRNISVDNKVVLRWALCTSDANKALYATSQPIDVADEYGVVSGVHDFSGTSTTLEIDAYGINSNAVYYLVFWGSIGAVGGSLTTLTFGYSTDHTLTVYYDESGRVYIDRGNASNEEKTVGCSMIGQAYNGTSYSVRDATYVGRNNSNYYTYILKFTTPDFVGIPNSLSFTFYIGTVGYYDVHFNYALCSSDENFSDYRNTTDIVVDNTQISSGTVTFSDLSNVVYQTLTISTLTGLSPNTDYYLIVWASSQVGMCRFEMLQHNKVNLQYTDTEVKFDMYEIYIDDGTNWYRYTPYIDNGTSWDVVT